MYPQIIYDNARLLPCTTSHNDLLSGAALGFVAVRNGIILAVGERGQAREFKSSKTRVVDCQGKTLIPGFVDAHCHVLALASKLCDIDCRPGKINNIPELVYLMSQEAHRSFSGSRSHERNRDRLPWIRAYGYDEFYLESGHHPTRWDLDRVSVEHPVRLDHRTGHAMVLNSHALGLLHITKDTPDPPDGVIQRDEVTGEPTGVLLEMTAWVNSRLGSTHDSQEEKRGLILANQLLLSGGITSVQDATPTNNPPRWDTFRSLKQAGHLVPRITMMIGKDHVARFVDGCPKFSDEDADLHLGALKVVITLTTGAMNPPEDELRELVLTSHKRGLQIAMHAVEAEAVEAAADALLYAQSVLLRPNARHRIEHCSECPPPLIEKLVSSRTLVVSQPGFLHDAGDRYEALASPDVRPHLYPFRGLSLAGVPLAAGSDAPVSFPDPLAGISAAVTRKSRRGSMVTPDQAISVEAALHMHTLGGAYAAFEEKMKGTIEVGKLADFVLLDGNPTSVEPEGIGQIRPLITVVGGEVVWQR